jgi:hypothetical protein
MRTQHVYVGKLVGFFFFAGTIALYSGGCGKTLSTDNQARACPYGDRGTLGSDPMTGPGNTEVQTICDEPCGSSYEPGYLAYCDPASSGTTSAEVVITEEYPSGLPGNANEGGADTVMPWVAGAKDEEMRTGYEGHQPEMNEAGGYIDREGRQDEVPWTPTVSDPEGTSEPTGDTDNGCWMPTAPGRDDGKETTTDVNSAAALTERPGTTVTNEAAWAWLSDVRLVVSNWWQAIPTGEDQVDTRPYEGYISSTPSDMEVGESTNAPTSEPPP